MMQAIREFPMNYLASLPLTDGKGDMKGVLTTDEATGTQLLAFMWIDRDCRYFISTCSLLEEAGSILCTRWTPQSNKSPNAEPECLEKDIAQPRTAETYYSGCGTIDQHNRNQSSRHPPAQKETADK
jgi:hypothetical protein